jgi:signal peptide peptidase SppA
MSNHQALSRIHGREAFVMPETADLFVSNLQQFARTDPEKSESLSKATRESVEFCYSVSPASEETRKPFIYQDGIAIIPIHGALLNRFPYSWGFVTGYQAIRRQMNAALEDDDVQLIVFDVDSPGGETAGCLELADEIRESRAKKPLLAVVDSLSCSAGYALASAATRMVATPSSKIGSIGVYIMHIDVSGAMDQAGIEITYIEAPKGGMKTAGSGYRKLDRKAAEYLQGFVDASYEEFVALVVANRGIEDADVRETEGRVFRSEEALALGLIDAVKTPTEAVSSFLAELGDDEPTESEDEDMTTESKTPAAAPEATSEADIQAAVAADRQRCAAIKALPEASKLPHLADQLALSGATVESAKASLTAAIGDLPEQAEAPAPKPQGEGEQGAAPVDQTNHLDRAMSQSKQPEVGAGGEGQGGGADAPKSDAEMAAAILADHSAATGRKYEPQA